MDYLKKIEKKKVLIRKEPYLILSKTDLEQLEKIAELLKKETDTKTEYIVLPKPIFEGLVDANKFYRNLLIKRKKAERALKHSKRQFNSLKQGIKTNAPEFYIEVDNIIKEMDVFRFDKAIEETDASQEMQVLDRLFELAERFNSLIDGCKKEIEKVKEEGLSKYVYCFALCDKDADFGEIGLFGSRVYSMQYGNIVAVVSDLPAKEYKSINFEENVKIHNKVIQFVTERFTTIPMSYNQVWKEDALKAFIKITTGNLLDTFKKIEGRKEFGLKIFKNNGNGFDEQGLQKELEGIRSCAELAKLGNKFSPDIILNVSYLVPQDKIVEMSNAIEQMQNKHKNLKIEFTGPWPLYNFVEVEGAGKCL